MNNIKKELEDFIEFKTNYNFVQKKIIEKEGCIYCEDELLKDKER